MKHRLNGRRRRDHVLQGLDEIAAAHVGIDLLGKWYPFARYVAVGPEHGTVAHWRNWLCEFPDHASGRLLQYAPRIDPHVALFEAASAFASADSDAILNNNRSFYLRALRSRERPAGLLHRAA